MARYRKVDPRIWNDSKFRSMSDNGKLVFLMLLTHPGMTALGAMRGSVAGLAEEMGWSLEAFREAFEEAFGKAMVKHDAKACLIVLPNFLKYNPPESPNVIKAWANALDLLPECELKTRVIADAKAFTEGLSEAFREAFAKAMPKASPKAFAIQEQEQEQEQEQDKTLDRPAVDPIHFEKFWQAGMKKIGRKKCEPLFAKVLRTQALPPEVFCEMLVSDIQRRMRSRQLGFSEMHPQTYLSGERWNDEVIQHGISESNCRTPARSRSADIRAATLDPNF